MTMGTMNTFTMSAFALPSFAAPSMSSVTSCANSFTCVLHVSPKGRREGTRVLPSPSLRCSQDALCPILRGAWVPPLQDDACHDEYLQQQFEEKVVVVAAAAAVVVVVRGGELAIGTGTFSTYYTQR